MTRGASAGKNRRKGGHVKKKRHTGASSNGVDYNSATKVGCSSGKWGWAPEARAGAKSLVRALRKAGDHKVREFMCPECGRWHVGGMPKDVQRGRRAASDIYPRSNET
jgi:hypothetical protein